MKITKIRGLSAVLLLSAISASTAMGQVTRWTVDADGNWADALNWDNGIPDTNTVASSFRSYTITLGTAGAAAGKFWNRSTVQPSVLDIRTNGNLTVIGDMNINEFSNNAGYNYAELLLNGGVLSAANLNIAARPTSQGEGMLVLNSGTVECGELNIGRSSDGYEVNGVATINDGSLDVGSNFNLGGAVNETGTGVLNVYGGTLTSTNGFNYIGGWTDLDAGITNRGSGTINVHGGAVHLGGEVVRISRAGASDGTINMHGGTLTALTELLMDSADDLGGKAEINLYGGELVAEAGLDVAAESVVHVAGGVLSMRGTNALAAVSGWVANTNMTWILGGTNMLTESWDAGWTNTTVLDYGYWTYPITSILYADYNDVSAGDTTVWAYNLSPLPSVPVSDGIATTNKFTNGSGDGLWTTPGNWDIGTVPTVEDTAIHGAISDYLIVALDLEVFNFWSASVNTSSTAIVDGGSLTLGNELKLGHYGNATGALTLDGGSVSAATLSVGAFAGGNGIYTQNSGSTVVGGSTSVGLNGNGVMTLKDGTYSNTGNNFLVGDNAGSSGVLNMEDGALNINTKYLVVGQNGTGQVNMTGGTIDALQLRMSYNATDTALGTAGFDLLGGQMSINATWDGALLLQEGADLHIEGGILQWAGADNKRDNIDAYISAGLISWGNGQTNMLTDSWEQSWTNGTDVLFADHNDVRTGYTTVWAYSPPVPMEPPGMTIAKGIGSSIDVTATNLFIGAAYDLMGTDSLVFTNWVSVGSTSGVAEATWTIPASDAVKFFQIQQQ